MSVLQWDQLGSRFYEAGLDHAVLYVDGASGVPWNGLTALEENYNGQTTDVYFDGVKINTIVTPGDFSGVIRALTYPDAFLECEGVVEDEPGLFLTDQPVKRFGLCYRTLVGEGGEDLTAGYKLHILYNLTATPATKIRQTLGLDVTPAEFEWEVTGIPEELSGYRPTAHIILDSRDFDEWLLQDIEGILYGTETRDPELPDLKSLLAFIQKWDRLIIVDNNDGTWTAISARDDIITMISPTEFVIEADNVEYLDPETYRISSSDTNTEDL